LIATPAGFRLCFGACVPGHSVAKVKDEIRRSLVGCITAGTTSKVVRSSIEVHLQ